MARIFLRIVTVSGMYNEMSDEAKSPPEPLSVYTMLTVMVDQCAMVAWQKLGLQHDMSTGKLERDLEQAKVAIDLTAHLSSLLELKLDDEDRRQINTLVRDLRMNYVNQMKESHS